jgi:biopolymer transport protein ExbB
LAAQGEGREVAIWPLFVESFDLFSVALIAGSLAAVALIIRCVLDVRPGRIVPPPAVMRLESAVRGGDAGEVELLVRSDGSLPGVIVRAAMEARGGGREAMREAAEMAASEECAKWFRRIEPLNVIGHLGPLLGLAGTVYGMVLAFASLGEFGGETTASDLSAGISKALFHTLLGLCLAIPCLLVFGMYRLVIDRACTRGMVIASGLVERLASMAEEKR